MGFGEKEADRLTEDRIADCAFCAITRGGGRLPVFDRLVWYDSSFACFPSAGSFVSGYLLLAPRRHAISFAALEEWELRKAWRSKAHLGRTLVSLFGPGVWFEHGMSPCSGRGGACVDHAHLHFLPVQASVEDLDGVELEHCDGLLSLSQSVGEGEYVFFEDWIGRSFVSTRGPFASQLMRRALSRMVGRGDFWDYAAFPFERLARKTLVTLGVEL